MPTDEEVFGPDGPQDWLGRSRIYKELRNPSVRDRLIAYTNAEVGGQGPEAQQAFMETIFNRSVARNQTLAKTLSGSYFPNVTHSRASRGVSPGMRDAYGNLIADSLEGNITNYATGNASGSVGFAGGPQTYAAGGERFGVEGPDRGWWEKVGDRGPPQDLIASALPKKSGGILSALNPVSSAQAQEAPMQVAAAEPRRGAKRGYSEEDVFGTQETSQVAPAPSQGFSEEDVFGKPGAPAPAAAEPAKPGIMQMIGAFDKALTQAAIGGVGTAISGLPGVYEMFAGHPIGPQVSGMLKSTGQSITEAARKQFPTTEEEEKRFTVDVPYVGTVGPLDVARGIGSVGTNIAAGAVGGLPLAGVAALSQGSGEALETAIKNKATEEQQSRAAALGTIPGATDLVDQLLPSFGSSGRLAAFIGKVGARAVKGAFAEGGQEGVQQLMQNAITQQTYKPDQDIWDDVPKSALVGAIVGSGVTASLGDSGRPGSEPPLTPPSTPNEAYAAMRGGPGPGTGPTPTPGPVPPEQGDLFNTPPAPPNPPPAEAPPASVTPPPPPPPSTTVPSPAATVTVEPPPASTGGTVFTEGGGPQTIEDFMRSQQAVNVPSITEPRAQRPLTAEDIAPTRQDVKSTPGVDAQRLARLLGPKLYGEPKEQTLVSMKEMFQNAFDAIKDTFSSGQQDGNINIVTNEAERSITMTDDGIGMTPEILGGPFLTIAGTKKHSDRASGGLGIAKMQFLYGADNLIVKSMRNGKVSELITSGQELMNALSDPKAAPTIKVRSPTDEDRALFPKGHGTSIIVTVPDTYVNHSTGAVEQILFPRDMYGHGSYRVLKDSPLFENINVTMNGEQVPTGAAFKSDQYTQVANVNFQWGQARIYTSKEVNERAKWGENVHVLSNGLWQFSNKLTKDPKEAYGENIPRAFYIDVSPRVKPDDAGYPFDLNRQRFVKNTEEDFAKIFKYIQLMNQQEDFHTDVTNFGEMQYLSWDAKQGRVANTMPFQLEPPVPKQPTALRGIKPGDKVTVKDGKLIVNGRRVPELKPEDIEKFKVNYDELTIPQDQIEDEVILHDNTEMSPTGAPSSDPSAKTTIVQYGVQKYGNRFYEFNFLVGNMFKQLRDVVQQLPGYSGLQGSGVGISFDQEYRGVNIIVPFRAQFINSFLPQYSDRPMRAAVGTIGTMIHELSHEIIRSHDASFQNEWQSLFVLLNTHDTFNFQDFSQKMINVYSAYWDMFQDLNGVYQNGDVRPRTRSLKGVGTNERSYGGAPRDMGVAPTPDARGSSLSDWVAVGKASVVTEPGRVVGGVTTKGTGSDPSFGRNANQRALDRETGTTGDVPADTQQPEFDNVRKALNSTRCASTCASQPGVAAAGAHADRMNLIYKYGVGLLELRDINPNHAPLRLLAEEAELMHMEESRWQNEGIDIVKNGWMRLGEQGDRLAGFVDDIANMRYRTPQEVANKVARHPTPNEFNALVAQHKLDHRGLGVFRSVTEFFNRQLDRMRENAIIEANRISDPIARMDAVVRIDNRIRRLRAKPYFPFIRFGRHYVTVRNAKGDVEGFWTFERRGLVPAKVYQDRAAAELRQTYPTSQGYTVGVGILPEQVEPFLGLPSTLLNDIALRMNLSQAQKNALEQLTFELSPALSFEHHFQNKKYTAGYSNDFMRAFSRYAFFSSRYIARTKWVPVFRQRIDEARALNDLGRKESHISEYMQNWFNKAILDARGDYGIFKGAIFFQAMGYSVAAATNNLFQTPMITFPWLSGRYGDRRAGAAILKQLYRWNSFYKRGYYPPPSDMTADFEMRAISWGIKTGRITETQAAELATLMHSSNVGHGRGLKAAAWRANWFIEKGAVFFEAAEQINRRIAFRAALQLAMADNNNRAVDEAVRNHPREYDQLVSVQGFTPTEARAIIASIDALQRTQFVYARYARPPFMRGRLPGTIFVFKRYIQSVVFLMFSGDRRNLVRYLIPLLLLGGAGAVPGYEDVEDLVNLFLKLSGIDSSLDKVLREFIQDTFGGAVPPDIVLHGFARRGFGLPWLLDQMGGMATGRPGRSFLLPGPADNIAAPVLDFSKGISPGPLLPVQIGKFLAPQESREKMWKQQVQRAAGATFSAGMNIGDMLASVVQGVASGDTKKLTDFKMYEKSLPRALASIVKGYEAFTEERSRGTRGGPLTASTVLKYDPRDPEQLMEIIAQGLGYNTLRESQKWDSIIMKAEHESYLKIRRNGIYAQLDEAIKGHDPQEISRVIEDLRRYNASLGPEERGFAISAEQAAQSLRARERNRVLQGMGLSGSRGAVPMRRGIDRLFPESVIDVQRR